MTLSHCFGEKIYFNLSYLSSSSSSPVCCWRSCSRCASWSSLSAVGWTSSWSSSCHLKMERAFSIIRWWSLQWTFQYIPQSRSYKLQSPSSVFLLEMQEIWTKWILNIATKPHIMTCETFSFLQSVSINHWYMSILDAVASKNSDLKLTTARVFFLPVDPMYSSCSGFKHESKF